MGAPFVERLRGNKALSGALAAITAAVVGVILNLAVWFALHTWFRETRPLRALGFRFDAPVPGSIDPWALALSAAALVAVFRFRVGMIATLLASSAIWGRPACGWRRLMDWQGREKAVAGWLTRSGRAPSRGSGSGPGQIGHELDVGW